MTAEHPIPAVGADGAGHPTVYLCQVGRGVSCGACCGLYNVTDLSKEVLEDRLARRSRRFAGTERMEDGIENFRRETLGWTPEERPFPRFPSAQDVEQAMARLDHHVAATVNAMP